VKDKHFYLLGVLRRRMDYPTLKRAVREQCQAFDAKVILIEDKASGTQAGVLRCFVFRRIRRTSTQSSCFQQSEGASAQSRQTCDGLSRAHVHAAPAQSEHETARHPSNAPGSSSIQ
jgi:phage terminase large subunit-like protein